MKQEQLVALLQDLTLEEKIGQLVQLTPDFFASSGEITGPMQEWHLSNQQLYQIGSVLGTHTAEEVSRIQRSYLENSRHQIPLLFMADVIHGYETIYPIPLALASSFDANLIETVAQYSAAEASRAGIHVTFSPMADYVKDARWGRVLESNGEDPMLSKALTEAYVRGYQGQDLRKETDRIAACVKHFIGYGAVEAGRDYNTVDLSEIELAQNYFPAFEGALAAGVKLVMTAFNTVHGIPVSGNKRLLQTTLRHKLGFDGVIISDWAAIAELINHRVAATKAEAAKLAFQAGVTVDMMSDCYLLELAAIITPDQEPKLDELVMQVLKLKNDLGLFENPYRGMRTVTQEEQRQIRMHTKQAAQQSAVLLKNEAILPLAQSDRIALVGPLAESKDVLGAWSWIGQPQASISLAEGFKAQHNQLEIVGSQGNQLTQNEIAAMVEAAARADKVVIAVGETSQEAGEAASKVALELEASQQALIRQIATVNPAIILVVFGGRPLILTEIEPFVSAIVQAWFLGSETGNALVALLRGEANFSGRLPMSFPRQVGQLPYSYRELSTGRPVTKENAQEKYVSRYLDEDNGPLYPFGYGLSYSQFELSELTVNRAVFSKDQMLKVMCQVENGSERAGRTTVQLYITDRVAEISLPKKELKQWQQVELAPHEKQQVIFELTAADFAYVHSDLERYPDPGEFDIQIGFDSQTTPLQIQVYYEA